jgi:activator of 2-hydroxyglutaryl-CoA dehydratase
MKLVDAGSTWCKLYDSVADGVRVARTKDVLREDGRFDVGTGHAARRRSDLFENDLLSLARGALTVVDANDFTVLDVGSRDAKYVRFAQRRPERLDWSVGCSTATGATVEMLGRFYEVDFGGLPRQEPAASVTCGVFALERIMDVVAQGEPPDRGIARFVHGLARQQWQFAGAPGQLYLSGGFCENRTFLHYLSRYCEVISLGRLVPLAGLWSWAREQGLTNESELPHSLRVYGIN